MTPATILSRRRLLGSALSATFVALPLRAQTPPAQNGFRVLEARQGALRLLPEPAPATAIWGYDGVSPGPLLRYGKGEEIRVRLINRLTQPTTLSWHGLRIVNAMDGVAGLTQPAVPPDGVFDYRFTPPDSGLYWYHPHVSSSIGEQLGRGLYGVLIVDEPEPPANDRDMLVVIDDWTLDGGAQIASFGAGPEAADGNRAGPLLTVNAHPAPLSKTLPPRSRLRLRIVSAVTTRVMQISFEGLEPLIIAVDGQPCEAFEPLRRTIPIGPGARFDVVVDLPAGPDAQTALILREEGGSGLPLLQLTTAGAARPELPPIASLAQNLLLPTAIRLESARKIDILIEAPVATASAQAAPTARLSVKLNATAASGWAQKPLFAVKRGAAVSLGLVNRTAFVQQIHVHGHHMRLLHDLDDGWEPYWRDSVLVSPGKTKHVAFVADNPGKWVIESLMEERLGGGLAAWFEVT